MNKNFPAWLFLLGLFSLAYSPGFAQVPPRQPVNTDQKLKPIEIHYATLTGLSYSLDSEFLFNDKEFENLIFPLNDYETTRLLKRSESSSSAGEIIKIIGFAGLLTGLTGLATSPSNQQAPFWITAITGGITIEISGFFQLEAQTAKFNCVQRYNRFARGEEQILPKATEDDKSLLDFDKTGNSPVKIPVTK